jgi:thiosulfate/3-mercaptopyruvate sulfurtransferase
MYRGLLVDRALLADDPHLSRGCASCHRGDEAASDKAQAHAGLVKRPSDDLAVCGACHEAIARVYRTSLHYTTAGLLRGVSARFAPESAHAFSQKVFPAACQSCHASCGDCHVKSPAIGGISAGLIKGHRFVRRDEGKTCALCHGGRVYPEFTGEYGGTPDVHYERGMMCVDCHKQAEIHGDGSVQTSRKEVKGRATCAGCHARGSDGEKSRAAHQQHDGRLCHASGAYRNCQDCHLGQGATAKPAFLLGVSPRDGKTITTLRLIPTVRDTFAKAGLRMEAYDKLPNYWDTAPHNLRKRTERTRSCDVCHAEKRGGFLTKDGLPRDGSRANEGLVHPPRDLTTR